MVAEITEFLFITNHPLSIIVLSFEKAGADLVSLIASKGFIEVKSIIYAALLSTVFIATPNSPQAITLLFHNIDQSSKNRLYALF